MSNLKNNKVYFKFQNNNEYFILPVYTDSALYKSKTFWDKEVRFIGEVTEDEYDKQFVSIPEPIQLYLF